MWEPPGIPEGRGAVQGSVPGALLVGCSELGELTELLSRDSLHLCCPQSPGEILSAVLAQGEEPP